MDLIIDDLKQLCDELRREESADLEELMAYPSEELSSETRAVNSVRRWVVAEPLKIIERAPR